jgi:hypothetical protein
MVAVPLISAIGLFGCDEYCRRSYEEIEKAKKIGRLFFEEWL